MIDCFYGSLSFTIFWEVFLTFILIMSGGCSCVPFIPIPPDPCILLHFGSFHHTIIISEIQVGARAIL